jgi:hypothetical protein
MRNLALSVLAIACSLGAATRDLQPGSHLDPVQIVEQNPPDHNGASLFDAIYTSTFVETAQPAPPPKPKVSALQPYDVNYRRCAKEHIPLVVGVHCDPPTDGPWLSSRVDDQSYGKGTCLAIVRYGRGLPHVTGHLPADATADVVAFFTRQRPGCECGEDCLCFPCIGGGCQANHVLPQRGGDPVGGYSSSCSPSGSFVPSATPMYYQQPMYFQSFGGRRGGGCAGGRCGS